MEASSDTSTSRFRTRIGIGTLWKLAESRFQNASKIFYLKIRWKLTIPFLESHFCFKKMQRISIKYKTIIFNLCKIIFNSNEYRVRNIQILKQLL